MKKYAGGEKQYLFGLLDHDRLPGRKLDEFRKLAQEMDKLNAIGFPYLPKPEIALAYSIESFKVPEHGHGLLTGRTYEYNLKLAPYEVEVYKKTE